MRICLAEKNCDTCQLTLCSTIQLRALLTVSNRQFECSLILQFDSDVCDILHNYQNVKYQ